jgi:selenocysteine lyase/cysteine desulfurase
MSNYMERGGANLRGVLPTSTETEEILTLAPDDLEKISEQTKLVAVGLASNDVAVVADRAHDAGAIVAVDAVHAAPTSP